MWTVSGQNFAGDLANGIQCCCETATTLSYYYNWIITNDTPVISTGKNELLVLFLFNCDINCV